MAGPGRWLMAAVALLSGSLVAAAPGAPQTGAALFTGARRLANGGPACGSCHNVAGLRYPFGGSLGPELGASALRLGDRGTRSALQTLFFPSMRPLFAGKPLTTDEQADLAALLLQAAGRPAASSAGQLLVLAVLGLVAALILTGLLWRHRLRAVRRPLVDTARAGRAP